MDREFETPEEYEAEIARLRGILNTPLYDDFLPAVEREAAHQINRWGTAADRAKEPADWFWLLGYLGGKALKAAITGDIKGAKHHCISSAAVLLNWHLHLSGADQRFTPGNSDLKERLETVFGDVDSSADLRPQNCRFRLKDEGQAYPKSSCQACGLTIATGLGKVCGVY